MIAMLRGLVDLVAEDRVVVDVGGVGYVAFCSSRTLAGLPGQGKAVRLCIETHVREDHIHLYGFLEDGEREWFRMLTTVQGVGARVALAILSVLSADELQQAVLAQDKTAVSRANGVGPKLAGRIVTELKDKTGHMALPVRSLVNSAGADLGGADEAAVSALVNLGFSRVDAFGAVLRAGEELGREAPVDELIRNGLKELAQ